MGRSLLTLDTLEPDRDFITVNGTAYCLRGDDELTLPQVARIRRLAKKVTELGLSIDSTEQEMAEIEGFANEVLALVVIDLPDPIRDKLSTVQKFQIVQAFTTVASSRRARGKTEEKQESSPTTGGSSQGSEGSTEAPSATT